MTSKTGHIIRLLAAVGLMGSVLVGLHRCGAPAVSSSDWEAAAARPLRSGIPDAPVPPRLVNDFAGVLGGRADELERILVAFDDSTSNQITVVTVPDLGDYAVEEYALALGRKWGVGAARNNGIVVLVKPKTPESGGEVTIQVGYGLEGAVTDAYAARIIRNEMIPAFKEEDYYTGVYNACDQIMKLSVGEISEPREPDDPSTGAVLFGFLLPLMLFFLVLWLMKKFGKGSGPGGSSGGTRRPFIWFGPGFGGGPSTGGWGGWDGSGGGPSGGSFGGFGGGSFGGGGASGRW